MKRLNTATLDGCLQGAAVKRILSAALDAADPAEAVRRYLFRHENLLRVNRQDYLLDELSAVYLVSIGKAAIPMAGAAVSILKKWISKGIVVAKQVGEDCLPESLTVLETSHPIPDNRSVQAGQRILSLLAQTSSSDLVIFLISGGGSALITVPVDGVSLMDMKQLIAKLLGCGAQIDEMNILRRALDRIKGGGLARAAFPAQTISLLLSDVIDSPLEAIASGPTVLNPTTRADALKVLKKYDLLHEVPNTILDVLQSDEKPVPDGLFSIGQVLVIGDNFISAQAAQTQATYEGFASRILTTSLQGEAAQIGRELAAYFVKNDEFPACLILGGETTVTLGSATGLGGRNQELALAAVAELAGLRDVMLVTLATDGEDGPTDAAGAVVTGETLIRAQFLGLDAEAHLRRHDSYPFFDALGDLLKPGPTGTNVNDLTFLFAF